MFLGLVSMYPVFKIQLYTNFENMWLKQEPIFTKEIFL